MGGVKGLGVLGIAVGRRRLGVLVRVLHMGDTAAGSGLRAGSTAQVPRGRGRRAVPGFCLLTFTASPG